MIKASIIARSRDSFLLCEHSDSMVRDYPDLRSKTKKLIGSEKCKAGELEFVELDNDTYVQ
jgi:hypothetical protein